MRCPANLGFVVDIAPFRVVFGFFAFGGDLVHEVLKNPASAGRSCGMSLVMGIYPSSLECFEFERSLQSFAIIT